MKPTVSPHILMTAWLLLSSCTALAATTTIQVPLAGMVDVLLIDGNFDEVTIAGRVNVTSQFSPQEGVQLRSRLSPGIRQ